MDSVRKIVREIIFENVAQAEKVLRVKNIPIDTPDYLQFKERLVKDNKVGYLGFIVNMSSREGIFSIRIANNAYNLIIDNKNIVNKLPKPLMKYDNYEELANDINKSVNTQIINKLSNKLTNDLIKDKLIDFAEDQKFVKDVEFLLKAKSADRKEFMEKTDKYKTPQEFIQDLKNFVDDLKIGFSYDIVLNKISSMDESAISVKLADRNKQMILARIIKYSASKELGSTSWCIVGEEHYFNQYTEDGKNYQYFFFNFNSDIPNNEKMIAFTMDKSNNVTASHDRYDNQFRGPVKYLSGLGILPKIFEINSRERTANRLNDLGEYKGGHNTAERAIIVNYLEYGENRGSTEAIAKRNASGEFLSFLQKGESLDLLIKKFENYPEYDVELNDRYIQNKIVSTKKVNLIPYILNDIDELIKHHNDYKQKKYWEGDIEVDEFYAGKGIKKNIVVDAMKKVYMSDFDIDKNTKVSIMHFLKDNGVDILKLSQQMKLKHGQDMSDMEVAMLSNRGENLRPLIQNKLSAIRRGEGVRLNVAEINYAIENGFADIIKKYYSSMLPAFATNQLSYEDMQVYQKLGMLDQVADVISKKGNIYGDDALNSIEKSIADISRRKARLSEARKIVREILSEIDWGDTFSDVKQVCVPAEDIVDYLNRVRANAPLKTKDREKFKMDKPFVHSKSTFFRANEETVDIDHFIAKMTEPPANVINTNEKILKSGGPHEYVYKTGIPAFRGIAYDIDNDKFHYINTCPGAGSCAIICYAMKGRYIQYPAAYDSMTRRLNYLLNYPDRYEEQMYSELKAKAEEHRALEGYKSKVILRWNDSGDFFANKYTEIAENVMKRLKDEGYNVDSYAYTKVADVTKDADFQTTFSSGANKKQSGKFEKGHKTSLVVPKKLFKDLDFMRIDDEKILKSRVAKFFDLEPESVISYDELISTPKSENAKWNVIVTPNDGDDAAFREDVKSILLTQH